MPLWTSKQIISEIDLLFWHITESEEVLRKELVLSQTSEALLKTRKSETHRKGFLATRKLLCLLGIKPEEVQYTPLGAPFLKKGPHISISHADDFAAVAMSKKHAVGVDVERIRSKILRIASKFVHPDEPPISSGHSAHQKLTKIWAAKEAVYKSMQDSGLSFKSIKVTCLENSRGMATLKAKGQIKTFQLYFLSIDNYEACVTYSANEKE